jgi:antirestriction protein ArdC
MSARHEQKSERRDIHAEITAKLIASIESDPGRPTLPWRRSSTPLFMPENALTRKHYNGINVVSLWVAAETRGFTAPLWATYRQWAEAGAQVRKGETSSPVVFYKEYETDPKPDDADDKGKRRVARASCVFNVAQVDGFPLPDAPQPLGPIDRIEAVDRFIRATGARIEHGGDRAFYRPSTDHIQMPDEDRFCGTDTMSRSEGYYAVLAHETIHMSGSEKRLDRQFGKRFGDAAYAAEELVAEIGSAFLCAELGITQDTRADHAQYLAQWLSLLKSDSRAVFTAAAKASEAVAYLKRLQPPS